jgi:trans-2,3-dihydro-3-hydroxyanthranilate isomerase
MDLLQTGCSCNQENQAIDLGVGLAQAAEVRGLQQEQKSMSAAERNQRSYRYRVVDVFTRQPLEGNPVAVFPDAAGLDDVTMQRIARELNLSETVFVLPATRSDCAVSVRIFTPLRELVFAGHPTVGTAFVVLEEGLVPRNSSSFVLEEKVGPVPIRIEHNGPRLIWLTTPSISFGMTFDQDLCARVLGLGRDDLLEITPQLLSAGNPTVFIPLKNKEAVDQAWLDLAGLKALKGSTQLEPVCVFVFAPTNEGAYSRMFAPEYGVSEDPATGSSTGPLAAFMMKNKLMSGRSGSRCHSEQGTKMGRRSILYLHIRGEQGMEGIDIGGHVTPVVEATLTL